MSDSLFDTRKYCLENKIVSFSLKIHYNPHTQKKEPEKVSWSKIKLENFTTYHDYNKLGFAILTGPNQIVVIDCDIAKAQGQFPQDILTTLDETCNSIVKTPNGKHYYFKTEKTISKQTGAFWKGEKVPTLDVIADKSFILAPPTTYTKGDLVCNYAWTKGNLSTITELPDSIYEFLQKPTSSTTTITSDIDLILKSISTTRFDDYESWVRIGFILFNEGYSVELWDKYSQRSTSYDPRACETKWRTFNSRDSQITKATLYYWLKEDNPVVYDELKHNLEEMYVTAAKNTDKMSATLFYYKKPTDYIYSQELGWLERKPNNTYKIYEIKKTPDVFNLIISDTLKDFIIEAKTHFKHQLEQFEKGTEQFEYYVKLIDGCNKTERQIETKTYINNMIPWLESFYLDPEIVNKIDSNPNLLAFEDKVFDFTTCEFRDILPTDYISTTAGYNAPDLTLQVVPQLQTFLNSLFEDDEVLNYILQLLAYTLWGNNKFQLVVFFQGAGGNGKGRLSALIDRCLNKYSKTLPPSYITSKTESKGTPLPELANCKSARFVSSSEPQDNEKIQVSFLKSISGQDKLCVRKLYASEFEFLPQFTYFLSINHSRLSKSDIAIARRLRVIEFPYDFKPTDQFNPENPSHRLANYELELSLQGDETRDSFMALLLRTFRDKVKNCKELITPLKVINSTKEYLKESNPIADWLETHYDTNAGINDRITATELSNAFKFDTTHTIIPKQMGLYLSALGFRKTQSHNKEFYKGFKRKELLV